MSDNRKKVFVTKEMDDEYTQSNGIKCLNPNCDNTNLEGSSLEVDGGTVTQEISCPICKWTWTDVYSLVGVSMDHVYDES
jgi:hypothetical protein